MAKEDEVLNAGLGLAGAIPGIGLGIQALGMGMSIVQGIKANSERRQADRAAEAALNEAKRKLSVNRLEGVQVPLSAYNEAFRTGIAQQQQVLAGLSESDPRALAAGVGKVQGAAMAQNEQTRQQMEQVVYDRDVMVANEQSNIDLNLAGISLQGAEGAQKAAMQREQEAAAAFSGAVQSAGDIGQGIYENSAFYGNNGTPGQMAKAIDSSGFQTDMTKRQMKTALGNSNITPTMRAKVIDGQYNPFGSNQSMQSTGLSPFNIQTGLIQAPVPQLNFN